MLHFFFCKYFLTLITVGFPPPQLKLDLPLVILPSPSDQGDPVSLVHYNYRLFPQEKHGRMKRFKRLTEMEIAMCNSVGEDSQLGPQWQAQIIPSEEDLGRFRKRIEELEEKKVSQVCTKGILFHQWSIPSGSVCGMYTPNTYTL